MASEIRVDKINSLSGVGTVTLSPTGVDISGITTVQTLKVGTGLTASEDGDIFFTGVCTATTFAGSGANLTALPAANITGTLPAISAANLTNIPAANVTGTLPALTAANLTNIPAANIVGVCTAGLGNASGAFSQGITEMDQWRITSQYSGGGAITTNLERNDSPGYEKIGTGMSHSSGVFTFPSTGIWLVSMGCEFQIANDSDRAARAEISVTTNNSSYTNYSLPAANMYQSSSSTYGTTYAQQIIDCTDTSQVKVKFSTSVVNSSTITRGESTFNYTYFTFLRLGDT